MAVSDLCVGDVLLLEAGDRVPADCLLIEEMDMHVDQTSVYKGQESASMAEKQCSKDNGANHIQNPDPCLLSGSLIRTGCGKAVVCAVGKCTLRE